MASAPHHLAAQAARDVLAEGGGAVEAMVAAAAVIAVVYPHMNSIGGDGFWLIDTPGDAVPTAVEACGPAAALADADFYRAHGDAAIPSRGPRAALTVAGTLSGWDAALAFAADRHSARLPLARLLAPAIDHAREGFVVSGGHARTLAEKRGELEASPGFVAAYGAAEAGAAQRYPDLAATLARLADAGLDEFYRGDLARVIAADLEAVGSPIRLADLTGYRAQRVAPLLAALPVGDLFNMPPPTQGAASLIILGAFSRLGVTEADGFAHLHGLVEATKVAFRRRNAHIGDPRWMTVDPADWLTPTALDQLAAEIDPAKAAPWPDPPAGGGTVWMGAADSAGVVVSVIQSGFWEFGSGVVPARTGLLWQNRGASFTLGPGPNTLRPGAKPFHTLNPALARLADGSVLAYGAMGGEGQPQSQAAVFSRHAMFGQPLQQAVSAPRWLLGRTWGAAADTLKIENRMPEDVVAALRAAGHDVELVEGYSDLMGHAGAVKRRADAVFEGAADPRADGLAAAL